MIHLESVRYAYPEATSFTLEDFDLSVEAGERILVTGPSGSGKSTLLRIVNGLVPHFYGGRFGGRAVVRGLDTRRASPQDLAAAVGSVFQDLPARFLTGSVRDEIAFSLELEGTRDGDVPARVEAIAERMGLARLNGRRIETLSAGEQARVAVAAAVARRPDILALDEPLAHVDPEGTRSAVEWIRELSRQAGITVLTAEHRTAVWEQTCHRVVRLPVPIPEDADGPPLPTPDFQPWDRSPGVLEARGLSFHFGKRAVLRGVDLEVRPGELTALIGRNGSGKTTLLRCLVGLERPATGEVCLDGASLASRRVDEVARRVGLVPQAPSTLLFADTVRGELELTLRSARRGDPGTAETWLNAFGLGPLADRDPKDLSAGERQRVALAAVLAGRPALVLLDEPTLGMDRRRLEQLGRLLRRLCRDGTGVLVATHDPGFVAEFADRAVLLADGVVRERGAPAAVLAADPVYGDGLEGARGEAPPGMVGAAGESDAVG